jgi:DNA mismatch endonuclease (patch repair protein)
MTDNVPPDVRSQIMARVKSKGMKPEMRVRHLLHGLGYRYRLHRKDLPGKPDLVFPSRHKVVFVNGCFWHNHEGCSKVRIPNTNRDYWVSKLERNSNRDKLNVSLLESSGWNVMVIWECQLKDIVTASNILTAFLEDGEQHTIGVTHEH